MSLTRDSCRHYLSLYETALTSRIDNKKSKDAAKNLLDLDSWRLNTLSENVRNQEFMTKDELEKLMDCKLSRGKFRPRLKQLISSNDENDVQVITDEAYTQLLDASDMEDVMTAVKKLSELKGVGPATATMILQAKYDKVAFMSDEAMLQVFNGDKTKLKYDNKTCGLFLEKINGLVEALSNEFSAAEVERALFAKVLLGTTRDETPVSITKSISPPPTKAPKRRLASATELQEGKKTSKRQKVVKKASKKTTKSST